MSEISASAVMALRQKTGVSMMACKKALEEANGDTEKAIELLRKQGEAKAASKMDRVASEGTIAIHGNVVVSIYSETDFVARNESFVQFAEALAKEAAEKGVDGAKAKFEQEKNEKVAQLGENIVFGEVKVLPGDTVGAYLHSNRKVAALVALKGGDAKLATEVAMHVAAMNPEVLSPDEVASTAVEKEKEIWKEQLAKEGKPAEIMEKIMLGKEKKFREESALVSQPFVKNQDQKVGDYVKAAGADLTGFVRVAI
jgi:elongation factor Ts